MAYCQTYYPVFEIYYILLYRPFIMKQKKTRLKCVNFNFGSLFPCELHRKFTSSLYSILCTLLLPLFSQLYSCGHNLGSSSPYVVLVRGWGDSALFTIMSNNAALLAFCIVERTIGLFSFWRVGSDTNIMTIFLI